jgi:Flp pilus assembly protein TadD
MRSPTRPPSSRARRSGRGLDRLCGARSFNADKDPEVNEVILLSATGSAAESLRLAERVVTEEPGNVDTWFALWAASLAAGERERANQALARVLELDPLRARILERLDPRSSTGS